MSGPVVLLTPSIVEQVVVRELVHLRQRNHVNHAPDFWRRVERAMPDDARRKAWLAARRERVGGDPADVGRTWAPSC